MPILSLKTGGITTTLAAFPQALEALLSDLSPILAEVAEEIILPAFGRNYDRSGLKKRTGVLRTAVTTAGAKGNFLEIRATGLTVGVDAQALGGEIYALRGRGPVVARKGKSLRFFDDNGKAIFAKRVKAAPPHNVIYLTESDYEKVAELVTKRLVEMGASAIK